jgi:hypothetical protein
MICVSLARLTWPSRANSAWSATRYLRTPSNQSMCQEREGGHARPPSPGTLIHCLFMVQSLP